MAKVKIKPPTAYPAAYLPPPPAPRLAAQLTTAAGELLIVAAAALGVVTAVNWLITGYDLHSRIARHPLPPYERVDRMDRPVWRCVGPVDRNGWQLCRSEQPPWAAPRRYPARYGA